jgi:guanine deaminase
MGKTTGVWKVPKKKGEAFMRAALHSAKRGMMRGSGGPFGAVLVKNGKVLAVSHNRVLKMQDPTCHAEINAIRTASRKLKTFDLSGCEIYSTTEPCPMCFAAIHWARIRKVYYGTAIADVRRRGFHELCISNQKMKRAGGSGVALQPRFLAEECRSLLQQWDRLPKKQTY